MQNTYKAVEVTSPGKLNLVTRPVPEPGPGQVRMRVEAVRFARRMGFRTVAIAGGKEKEKLARELGAHEYIDSASADPGEELRKWGGAKAILATAANSKSQGPLMGGLATRGKLIVVGVGSEPIEINPAQLIFGSRTIQDEVVGTSIDEEDILDFSALQAVRPMIERVPLEQAAEAYGKMMRNEGSVSYGDRFLALILTQSNEKP